MGPTVDSPGRPALERAVDRLVRARAENAPCSPLRDLLPDGPETAYAVQRSANARIFDGERVVGRKIGLTSTRVQQQLGVDQPDFGVLFESMQVPNGAVLEPARFIQPRAEGEIAFLLGTDLDGPTLDLPHVRSAIAGVCAAIEICDSRVRDWDITFVDTVADNASAGAFVLSDEWVALSDVEPARLQMTMTATDAPPVAGDGSASLGDPLEAVAWLARTARCLGDPLRAGDVVLSGALAPMIDLVPGRRITVSIPQLGTACTTFGGDDERGPA